MDEMNEVKTVDTKAAKKVFSRLGLGAFVILALGSILQGVCFGIVSGLELDWLSRPWGVWVVNFVPLYLIAVSIGLLIMKKAPALKPEQLEREKMGFGRWLVFLLIGIFMMYAGNIVGNIITSTIGALRGGKEVVNPLEGLVMGSSLLPRILVVVIIAPVLEELIFRKVMIDRMRIYGEKLAVVTSALMFGLFHGNLSQFFYAFALGLVFGYAYLKTGKLRHSVALHMTINCLGSVVAPTLMENINLDALQNLDAADPATMAALMSPALLLLGLYIILMIGFAIAGLVLLCTRQKNIRYAPAEQELPREARFKTVWINVGMILFVLVCLALVATTLFGIG